MDQGAVGRHGCQPRQGLRVGALAGDTPEKVHQFRHHRQTCQGDGPSENGDVGIQSLAGQQGSVGWACHPHRALDADVFLPHLVNELRQLISLVIPPTEQLLARFVQRFQTRRPAQHLRHQSASGMGDQVQHGTLGAAIHQGEGIVDGRCCKRGVIEGIHPGAVVAKERIHLFGMVAPEPGKAAVARGGKRAMDQHQGGCSSGAGLDGGGALSFQRCECFSPERIDPFVDATVDPIGQRTGGHALQLVFEPDDIDHLEHHISR